MRIDPPASEAELLDKAKAISGKTLQQIATIHKLSVPLHLRNAKGWIGELIEISLGASATSLPEPDFQYIGVELKTIPVNHYGKPKESTYVCTASLTPDTDTTWETSLVKRKLSRVLWVPIEADPDIPLPARRVGTAIPWSPDRHQENVLRQDWEEFMDMIMMGELEQITARHGQYLQIRPKAANAKALRKGFDMDGNKILTMPRGFYLRASFTSLILEKAITYLIHQ